MSIPKRKIGFHEISLHLDGEDLDSTGTHLFKILREILAIPREQRIDDYPGANRFILLGECTIDRNIAFVVMHSAKYRHRPPLINKNDAIERDSPKLPDEGDREMTHIGIRLDAEGAIVLAEERKEGVSMGKFCTYVERMSKKTSIGKKLKIERLDIVRGEFLEELRKLKKVQIGELIIDKQVLGSEFADSSRRLSEVKDEIMLTTKSNRGGDIRNYIGDLYQKYLKRGRKITRIRARGIGEHGGSVLLDTSRMRQIEHVDVDLDDETNTVRTVSIFSHYKKILTTFE
jgi:hypothetical protein